MKFKCLLSGTVIDVVYPVDIEAMSAHPQYEKVEDEVEVKPKGKDNVQKK